MCLIRLLQDKLSQSLVLKSKIINKYSGPMSKFLFEFINERISKEGF